MSFYVYPHSLKPLKRKHVFWEPFSVGLLAIIEHSDIYVIVKIQLSEDKVGKNSA